MDNLTHSLVGLVVGDIAFEARTEISGGRRRARRVFWLVSLIANNFPDLDFIYTPITEGKIGYLLHHRGHTHTMLAAFPSALLILAAAWAFLRFRRETLSRTDWWWLAGLSVAGLWLHILLDSLNSYGVHPFWPFLNRWYYGDTLFILEPTLWFCLVPALLFREKRRWIRVLLAIPFFGGIGLLWAVPLVHWLSALVLTLLALLVWRGTLHVALSLRTASAAVLTTFVIALYAAVSHHTRETVSAKQHATHPDRILEDIILSPLPANLICWTILVLESDRQGGYRARRGIVSAFPGLLSAVDCPKFRTGEGIAAVQPSEEPLDPQLWWHSEYRGSATELRELATTHCGVMAMLGFARAPFVLDRGDRYLAGDLRFDFSRGLGFAQLSFPREMDHCPRHVPPWEPPRAAFLGRHY